MSQVRNKRNKGQMNSRGKPSKGSLVATDPRMGFSRNGLMGSSNTTYSLGGTPNIARMKLVYTVNKTVTATAGGVQDQVFSGNGCFDPDITAAGAQPTNFDDWSALYGRYRVLASRLTVYPLSQGASTGAGVWFVGIAARHTTTAVSTTSAFDSAMTQPFADMISVGASSGGGGTGKPFSTAPYSAAYSTAQVLGYDESAIRDDDTLQALTSANPNHQWYWHVMIRVADDTTTGDGRFYCKVEYDVEFFDRLDTLIDLNARIYRDLERLTSRAKREEKLVNTREAKERSRLLSELLFEYKDQILSPAGDRGDGPSVIPNPSLGRTTLVHENLTLSHEVSSSDRNGRDSFQRTTLRRT